MTIPNDQTNPQIKDPHPGDSPYILPELKIIVDALKDIRGGPQVAINTAALLTKITFNIKDIKDSLVVDFRFSETEAKFVLDFLLKYKNYSPDAGHFLIQLFLKLQKDGDTSLPAIQDKPNEEKN